MKGTPKLLLKYSFLNCSAQCSNWNLATWAHLQFDVGLADAKLRWLAVGLVLVLARSTGCGGGCGGGRT